MLDFTSYSFATVVDIPVGSPVFDFSQAASGIDWSKHAYGIGRYDEERFGVYEQELFSGERNIHMGIDLAAPAGTQVCSFYEGEVFKFTYHGATGDYGYTLVTCHELGEHTLYALYGHLSEESLAGKTAGQRVARGETIAWLGETHENGGWPPHLHFQLSWRKPAEADMPGVVCSADRAEALQIYPDPRLVLGPIY